MYDDATYPMSATPDAYNYCAGFAASPMPPASG